MTVVRTYSELLRYESYGDRLEYLKLLDGNVTSPKHISERLYENPQWEITRQEVITRDLGCDLGVNGEYVDGPIIVHHMNPITEQDILEWNVDRLFNPEYLISTRRRTHNVIHYGEKNEYVERTPGDTNLW